VTPLARLQEWLSAQRVDAACVTNPVSIAYLTGFRAEPGERLMALAVTSEAATLVVPALEEENAESRVREVEVVAWKDGQDPWALLGRALPGSSSLGVEKGHLTLAGAERLRARVSAPSLIDVGEEIRGLRLLKSPAELEILARACAATDRVSEAVFGALRPGQTEAEVASLITQLIGAEGSVPSFPSLVQSGPNSALPHLLPGSRRLQAGDLVLLDFGAAVEGYKGDTTRMAVIGAADARQQELHHLVVDAHDAAIAAVRPGVLSGEVDAAARRVISAAGLGDRFFHRVGHGLGLEVHEDPSLDPGSSLVLEEGMVFTIEPGVYLPGWGGIRVEDDVVVEAAGARMLTHARRDLVAVG
jgi:Xaa-Pro dipeptidase